MWASQFWYTRIKNGGLSIVPSKNLIKNMGIIGTHSNKENKLHKLDKCENYSISREPLFVLPDINFDNIEFRKVIAPPNHLYTRIYRKIKKTLLYHK